MKGVASMKEPEVDTAEDRFWQWFALGVLLFCWLAEATLSGMG